jgi:sialate O-acetylesterase
MAVAMDLGDPDSPHGSIHPRDKQDVGMRLRMAGQAVAYGDTSVYMNGPIMKNATLVSSTNLINNVVVYYNNVVRYLFVKSDYGFELSCVHDDTEWVSGTIKEVNDKSIRVEFPQCYAGHYPEVLRYAWRQDPCAFQKCGVYAIGEGYPYPLPAPPFIMRL